VAALAFDIDVKAVRLSRHDPVSNHDLADIVVSRDMRGENRLDIIDVARIQDGSGPATRLLGGLKHKTDFAGLWRILSQQHCGTEDICHVNIVSTGMHPAVVPGFEVEPRLFVTGESIQLGPDRDRRSGFISFEARNDATADTVIFIG
jgi:hypothetical protein